MRAAARLMSVSAAALIPSLRLFLLRCGRSRIAIYRKQGRRQIAAYRTLGRNRM
jgi:hypothetical protein